MTPRPACIIVGAGAAGLLLAARLGKAALLLDANTKPGKKLLATGNGRCNLTHDPIDPAHYHGDSAAAGLLAAFPASRVRGEFRRLGLLTRADAEGRCYPNSLQAASVLQALWGACQEAGVSTRWEAEVTAARREQDGFAVTLATGETLLAPRLILATGGKAAPAHGGGRGYGLARSLGHTVTPLSPSLAPLKTSEKALTRAMKGQRCRARAALCRNGRELYAEAGEVIFAEGQLSGICIFDLSARLREHGFQPGAPGWSVTLDPLPELSLPELTAALEDLARQRPGLPAADLFSGALNLRLGGEVVKKAGLPRDLPLSRLTAAQLQAAARAAKALAFPLLGPAGWESAQVTAGGVPLAEVDPRTLESRLCPGLTLVGELLDVDGDCGGYNLHWAWTTALAAAEVLSTKVK